MLVTILTLTGCTWGTTREPGLFNRQTTDPTAAPTQTTPTASENPPPENPELPVVGDAVWTTGEGLEVTVRIAVHAVRRMTGGTVLDWSVTPLSAPGFSLGNPLPNGVDLGLTRIGPGNTNVFLLVPSTDEVFRPLSRRNPGLPSCLCTPVWLVQRELIMGRTALLQTAYPPVPDGVATVDVDITTVPTFAHVPVTPAGMVPLVANPTSLTRPDSRSPVVAVGTGLLYREQRFWITVDAVYVSTSFTSLRWTISALDGGLGPGLDQVNGPPFAEPASRTAYNPAAASGPRLIAGNDSRELRTRLATTRLDQPRQTECLCTDLRLWTTGMGQTDAQISVVTNFAALPIGTTSVLVTIPGVAEFSDVEVTRAPDGTFRSAGPAVNSSPQFWRIQGDQTPSAWSPEDWPTPLPDPDQIPNFEATVDTLVR